jgi:hypothetical protein
LTRHGVTKNIREDNLIFNSIKKTQSASAALTFYVR